MAPTTNAKFTNPIWSGVKRYGGAPKTCAVVRFSARSELAAKPMEREAQAMMGKVKRICIGETTSRRSMETTPCFFFSSCWGEGEVPLRIGRMENWARDGRPVARWCAVVKVWWISVVELVVPPFSGFSVTGLGLEARTSTTGDSTLPLVDGFGGAVRSYFVSGWAMRRKMKLAPCKIVQTQN